MRREPLNWHIGGLVGGQQAGGGEAHPRVVCVSGRAKRLSACPVLAAGDGLWCPLRVESSSCGKRKREKEYAWVSCSGECKMGDCKAGLA
jgi:hypothetical protein